MQSAVEFYGCVDAEMRGHLKRVRELMAAMSDNGDKLWSCHAATRGFRAFLGLPYETRDGFFIKKGTCHSWLFTLVEDRPLVIDVLPMGAHGGPIVADIGRFAPWEELYIENGDYYADRLEAFEEEGKLFAKALAEADAVLSGFRPNPL
ncbi:hypothetical protein OIU34_19035 [Pararhizobium sp. BT-229]|uniref:hypothetical protein n=1 Tax=Pararhizobium sp. BT-229 TaxID=2986923 RepID=UPI0021F7A06F|nr:hypothetical protein [Pararhizobium sp. BT-229]MCV9963977.1 hypothetical protein [Pararhizobium sp. BT-229]